MSLGFDESFRRVSAADVPSKVQEKHPTFEEGTPIFKVTLPSPTIVPDDTVWIIRSIFELHSPNIHSRATRVWLACDKDGNEYALREAWGVGPPERAIVKDILRRLASRSRTASCLDRNNTFRAKIFRILTNREYENYFLLAKWEGVLPAGMPALDRVRPPRTTLFPVWQTKQAKPEVAGQRSITTSMHYYAPSAPPSDNSVLFEVASKGQVTGADEEDLFPAETSEGAAMKAAMQTTLAATKVGDEMEERLDRNSAHIHRERHLALYDKICLRPTEVPSLASSIWVLRDALVGRWPYLMVIA